MKILLITPAARRSRSGNRTTAERWAGLLRRHGHRVSVACDYHGEDADLMLALHAWRSAVAIRAWRENAPEAPLVVALTGTDIYRFRHSDPKTTLGAMHVADVLIGLHARVGDDVPPDLRERLHVVYQSAEPLPRAPSPPRSRFNVCVVGHLREEKDPLRTALAVRELPKESRLRVTHLGKAHDERWAASATEEMRVNARYRWHGEVPRGEVRRVLGRSHLMVISSRMEGGANVVSEACVAGLSVIASDIPGNRGLLGEDYPGYFPVEDTQALRALLLRAEREPAFLHDLARRCRSRAKLFTPEEEGRRLAEAVALAQSRNTTGSSASP